MRRKNRKVSELENILRKYFNFQVSTPENYIIQRDKAYDTMINFICDLSETGIDGIDEGELIDELNKIIGRD
ncbi:MAG: hypothetical protein HFJ30_00750 [Clostridia bacterium]|jgi:hypothetical protein|nr:hypothetical protein [Clostridia bacterium]